MSAIQLNLEDDLTALLRQENQPVGVTVREFVVLELYRRGSLSSGKAAQLLQMSRPEFIRYASRLGIPFYEMTPDEWDAERALSESL